MLAQLQDVVGDCEGARRRGGGRAQDVDEPARFDDAEVINQVSIPLERHGAYAAPTRLEVVLAEVGDELLELAKERRFRERAVELLESGPPVLARHAKRTGESGHLPQIAHAHVGLSVALPRERQDGVRSRLDLSIDAAGEMNSQKRKPRGGGGGDKA